MVQVAGRLASYSSVQATNCFSLASALLKLPNCMLRPIQYHRKNQGETINKKAMAGRLMIMTATALLAPRPISRKCARAKGRQARIYQAIVKSMIGTGRNMLGSPRLVRIPQSSLR